MSLPLFFDYHQDDRLPYYTMSFCINHLTCSVLWLLFQLTKTPFKIQQR